MKIKHPDITVVGGYVNNKTKVLCLCNICKTEWEALPSNLLKKTGCPKCGVTRHRKSKNSFLNEVYIVNPDIEVLDDYINSTTKLLCKCKKCNYEWKTIPHVLLRGSSCPICAIDKIGQKNSKTHEKFIEEMSKINPNIEILSKYKNNKEKVKCLCKTDSNIWWAAPSNLLQKYGCPKCNISKGENRIYDFLEKHKICNIRQKKFKGLLGTGGGNLSYDFYLPSHNLLIEYNGKQHYQPMEYFGGNKQFETQLEHDKRKRNYAKENGIELIEISYLDFNNIEQILERRLLREVA